MTTAQCVHCDFCGKSEHEVAAIVRGPKADICGECANYVTRRVTTITDEQIVAIANSMPGGLDGFLKGWGWCQFARKVLDTATGVPTVNGEATPVSSEPDEKTSAGLSRLNGGQE